MADSIKASIAELTGIKPQDVKAEKSARPMDGYIAALADAGFAVRPLAAKDPADTKHLVLYTSHEGVLHGAVAESADTLRDSAVTRLVIEKQPKASKAGESKA